MKYSSNSLWKFTCDVPVKHKHNYIFINMYMCVFNKIYVIQYDL